MSAAAAPAPQSTDTRQAPTTAFLLTHALDPKGAFAAGAAAGDAPVAGQPVPVVMTALSGEPLEHWYWGRIVLDLAGMQLHKQKLAIDWCHDPNELLGYLDGFDAANGRGPLTCRGALTPVAEGDRAATVIAQGRAGVPFEASVYWEAGELDYLEAGFSATVNGRPIEGPIFVARQWRLRGVAVCPWGVDHQTVTQFATSTPAQRTVRVVGRTTPPGATAMSDQPTPAPTPAPAPEPKATPAPAAEAPGAKFMTTFGEQRGALYFARGLSFEQATTEHLQWQAAELQRLSAAPNPAPAPGAGAKPVPFTPATEGDQPKTFASAFRIAGRGR